MITFVDDPDTGGTYSFALSNARSKLHQKDYFLFNPIVRNTAYAVRLLLTTRWQCSYAQLVTRLLDIVLDQTDDVSTKAVTSAVAVCSVVIGSQWEELLFQTPTLLDLSFLAHPQRERR